MNSRMQIVLGMVLIIVAALSRLIPHPMNFAPVTAIALFGGFYFDKRFAPILPLAALFLSDLFLGFYSGIVWVYGSFLLIVFLGMFGQNKKSFGVVAGSTFAGSLLFFLITNFGVWQSGILYPLTMNGLAACYAAALPFFRNALIGDIVYVTVMFGVFELALKYVPAFRTSKA